MGEMDAPYVELHAHSAFSFLDGASTPMELAAAAAERGYPAFALTDHDGIWGSMEFARACKGFGVWPVVGAELTVRPAAGPDLAHLTLLVEDATGYRNLCQLLTVAQGCPAERSLPSRVWEWATVSSWQRLR